MMYAWVLSLWFFGCSAVQTHRAWLSQSAEWQGFERKVVDLGPHRIHHWVGGEGPTVILLHGFGGNGLYTWWAQAKALSKSHQVVVPDLLWFGESASKAEPSLDAQADAIQALVDHVLPENQPVDVVGISYGGFVALRYGQVAPERQRKLVIVDSPGTIFNAQDEEAMLTRYRVRDVNELFVPTSTDRVRALIELAYHKPPPLPEMLLRDLKEHVFSNHQEQQRALLADLKTNRDRYQTGEMAAYKDKMVIWGEFDSVFPVEIGKELAAKWEAQLVVVKDAGHAPILEKPRIINEKLISFLEP